jgi:hypothetical protein
MKMIPAELLSLKYSIMELLLSAPKVFTEIQTYKVQVFSEMSTGNLYLQR